MVRNSLETFIEKVRESWRPLSTEVVDATQQHLADLLKAPATEVWLSALHSEAPANKELYRDPQHGFVLLAHTEPAGLFRPPHDHGGGWVIYAMKQGEIKMRTYGRIETQDGGVRLVRRNSTLVLPGQVQLYLPGDIHDTRCMSGPALLFRFTDRDLKKEDKEGRRVTRYVEREGDWTVGAP